jgi:hypothetical protein
LPGSARTPPRPRSATSRVASTSRA